MLGLVVLGSRTWMWTTAAPALAASTQDCAICAGLTGTAGFFPGESADPVTAHEMMTLRCIVLAPRGAPVAPKRTLGDTGLQAESRHRGRCRATMATSEAQQGFVPAGSPVLSGPAAGRDDRTRRESRCLQ